MAQKIFNNDHNCVVIHITSDSVETGFDNIVLILCAVVLPRLGLGLADRLQTDLCVGDCRSLRPGVLHIHLKSPRTGVILILVRGLWTGALPVIVKSLRTVSSVLLHLANPTLEVGRAASLDISEEDDVSSSDLAVRDQV